MSTQENARGVALTAWLHGSLRQHAWAHGEFTSDRSLPSILCPWQTWRAQGKRGIWLSLSKARSSLVPVAVEKGFDFHHADPGHVMMVAWLPEEASTLPPNASHQVCACLSGVLLLFPHATNLDPSQ